MLRIGWGKQLSQALYVAAKLGVAEVINFGEEMYRAFGDLLHTVRTGETAFDGPTLLAYAGGRERAEAEFKQVLDQPRLRLVSTTPLAPV